MTLFDLEINEVFSYNGDVFKMKGWREPDTAVARCIARMGTDGLYCCQAADENFNPYARIEKGRLEISFCAEDQANS